MEEVPPDDVETVVPEAAAEEPPPEPEPPPAAPEVAFPDEASERRYITLEDLASPEEEPGWVPPAPEAPPAGDTPFFKDHEPERPLGTWTWDDIEGVPLGLPDLTDLDAALPPAGPHSLDDELPAQDPLTEDEESWMETGELALAAEIEVENLRAENGRLLSDREHLRARQNVFLLAGSLVGLALGLILGAWLI